MTNFRDFLIGALCVVIIALLVFPKKDKPKVETQEVQTENRSASRNLYSLLYGGTFLFRNASRRCGSWKCGRGFHLSDCKHHPASHWHYSGKREMAGKKVCQNKRGNNQRMIFKPLNIL